MLMKCKTCSKEFIPPKKNVKNCAKCISIKKVKNIDEDEVKNIDEDEVKIDEDEIEIEDEMWGVKDTPIREGETLSSSNNDSIAPEQDNDNDTIEQQPYIPNQLSNGEIMCGSVIINDGIHL